MDKTPSQEDGLYFYENEETDVEIFQKFVTPHYKPCKKPIAMAVGALLPTERSVIKVYNQRQFGIPAIDTRVAMANIDEMPPSMKSNPRFQYDHSSFGIQGDARMSHCYMDALHAFNGFERNFDLVYIRNPDFVGGRDWSYIFGRALEWTAPDGGVVVTLVRENDVRKYEDILISLKNRSNITPVFSGETGIGGTQGFFEENFQHTIGIFKPRL
jgi:hypothetical protein